MASPWGDGPAGLAHRVRGDVARPARRGLRPARRRAGPGLPPPRERAGPGRGRRPPLRPHLGAQRLRRGRGHEDVQVARQRHQPGRPGRAVRPPRLPAAGAALALPVADRRHRRHARDAEAALDRLDAFARRAAATWRTPTPTPRPSTGSGRHGRRPADARGHRPGVRPGPPGQRGPRRRRRRGGRPGRGSRSPVAPGPRAAGRGDDDVPDEVLGWAASATRPGRPRTGPRPTPCATGSPAPATSSRTRRRSGRPPTQRSGRRLGQARAPGGGGQARGRGRRPLAASDVGVARAPAARPHREGSGRARPAGASDVASTDPSRISGEADAGRDRDLARRGRSAPSTRATAGFT